MQSWWPFLAFVFRFFGIHRGNEMDKGYYYYYIFFLSHLSANKKSQRHKRHVWFTKIKSKKQTLPFFFLYISVTALLYYYYFVWAAYYCHDTYYYIHVLYLSFFFFFLQNTITYLSVTWVQKLRRKHYGKRSRLLAKYREYIFFYTIYFTGKLIFVRLTELQVKKLNNNKNPDAVICVKLGRY